MPKPPTPSYLKLLRGNPGKRAIRPEPEPSVPPSLPSPPDFLSDEAREEWRRIGPELFRLKLLTVLDIAPLAAYCQSSSHWVTAERLLRQAAAEDPATRGLTSEGTRGPVVNPLVRVAARAADDMLRYASEFGMTPVARTRIAAGIGAEPKSKF